jgi:hypothetical protein
MHHRTAQRRVPSVLAALVFGLALAVAAIGVVLSRSPITVAGTNSVPASSIVAYLWGGVRRCERGGTLPQGTSAIRVSAFSNTGPRTTLKALSGPLVLTHGERDAGWGVDASVTVPVRRVPRTVPNTTVCMALGPALEPVGLTGIEVPTTTANGRAGGARFRMEYLRAGHRSWWSLAPSVARRMGLGRAASGTWIVFVVIALMITVAALASRLLLRELR